VTYNTLTLASSKSFQIVKKLRGIAEYLPREYEERWVDGRVNLG
jgi:hypothetical protein